MEKVLLFDLGGVLVEFDGISQLVALSNTFTIKTATDFWQRSMWLNRFESGACSEKEFAEGFLKETGLLLSAENFIKEFVSWEKGPFAGSLELLETLKPHFTLACLSNNNSLHWEALTEMSFIERKFKHCYISYQLGLLKPDPQIFHYVIKDMKVHPQNIYFFDDNLKSVETARSLGINAFRVAGLAQLKSAIRSFFPDF
jgi:glucose-1-phosphatase